jgi:hypothetical protein
MSRSIASSWPIAPKAASSVSVPVAIISAASVASSQSRTTCGAYMPRAPATIRTRIAVRASAVIAAMAHFVRSVWRFEIATGRRWRQRGPISVVE